MSCYIAQEDLAGIAKCDILDCKLKPNEHTLRRILKAKKDK